MTNSELTKEQLFIELVAKLSTGDLFFGHGVIDAEDEAMMVVMRVFDQSVDGVLSTGNSFVDSKQLKQARSFVKQRLKSQKPMAYILGRVHFAGLEFYSDERALVPRSPIAELILSDFQPWVEIKSVARALDLCTGSGCIGIALAKYNPHCHVDIADISNKALDLAKENIEINKLKQSVTVITSDLFSSIEGVYDLIVTNPPYVSFDEYDELPIEYKKEPKLGLVTEGEGLRIPVKILLDAPKHMSKEAYLFLEVGYSDELLDATFPDVAFDWITFENGGQGVCVFSRSDLVKSASSFKKFLYSL